MRVTKKIKEKQLEILEDVYGNSKTMLHYSSPFELLVAVVLSAQCTDERVNIITARIFPKLNSPAKMAKLSLSEMESEIRDCGLYKAKSKYLLATCKILIERYGCEIPNTFEELVALPGVGRKTANVLISILFNQPAIAVDTHVFRVSNRLGLARGATPLEVELQLQKVIPRDKWSAAHHWLIWHGRKVCKARTPLCLSCPLNELCPSAVSYQK